MIISVITVSYNSADTIKETIESVINQKNVEIEYILIDGGSIDGTVDIIKSYEHAITRWISEPANPNPSMRLRKVTTNAAIATRP